jgi:hypothetical protein
MTGRAHKIAPGSDHDPVAGARCRPLAQGDPAPLCIGVSIANTFYSFLGQAGRPVALILAASVGMPELPAFVGAFASHLDEAARLGSDIILLINGDPLGALAFSRRQPTTVPIVICMSDFFERCGLPQDRAMAARCRPGLSRSWMRCSAPLTPLTRGRNGQTYSSSFGTHEKTSLLLL